MQGEGGIVEPAYVYLPGIPGGKEIADELGVNYFPVPIELGRDGAVKAFPLGELSKYEAELLTKVTSELKDNIARCRTCR